MLEVLRPLDHVQVLPRSEACFRPGAELPARSRPRGRETRRERIRRAVLQRQNRPWVATMMSSPYLPAELLYYIVDHLQDTKDALKSCGLVSKSWIPRTRRHLFADIKYSPDRLQSWKTTFLDPSSSPASYTKYFFIGFPPVVTAADAEGDGWTPTFSNVVHFEVDIQATTGTDLPETQLALFYGFSPLIKTLHMSIHMAASQCYHALEPTRAYWIPVTFS